MRSANECGIPALDLLLIALNHFGAVVRGLRRVRLYLTLELAPECEYLVIVPAEPPNGSPFSVSDGLLLLAGEAVGTVRVAEVDDAVGGYFRGGGGAVTLSHMVSFYDTYCNPATG